LKNEKGRDGRLLGATLLLKEIYEELPHYKRIPKVGNLPGASAPPPSKTPIIKMSARERTYFFFNCKIRMPGKPSHQVQKFKIINCNASNFNASSVLLFSKFIDASIYYDTKS
jgi:hypothetical protein